MKVAAILLFTSLVSLPAVPLVAQAGPISAAKEVGVMSTQMILALVAICSSGALIKLFMMWRKDVEAQQEKTDKSHARIEALVADNSVAMTQNSTSNREVKEALYTLSNVISNCEEVRKVQGKQ